VAPWTPSPYACAYFYLIDWRVRVGGPLPPHSLYARAYFYLIDWHVQVGGPMDPHPRTPTLTSI
jgi:hypothetical protein